MLFWNGNKCYLGLKKKSCQFSHISTLGMKKFQTPDLDENETLCLVTELSASRAASLCFDPLIRMLAAMARDPREAQPRMPWAGWLCPPGGWWTTAECALAQHTPWHLPHPCLLHSVLEQDSPGCLGVFTLPCEHIPPVFIYTARNKGKQIKKKLGLFPSALPQSTEHPACSTAETCCSCSSLLGTACLASASSCFRSWYPYHTEIQSPLCLIYHCAWLWGKVGCGDFCTRQCTVFFYNFLYCVQVDLRHFWNLKIWRRNLLLICIISN